MADVSTLISEDLDRIEQLLEELGQHTPIELRDALSLCQKDHIHSASCDNQFKLIVYIHKTVPWGPVWVRTNSTSYIEYSLPLASGQREWRKIPWPPALCNIFFPTVSVKPREVL
mgnify:CR=1 FL=1